MNQTYVTLNDGNKIPQFGLGVYMIPGHSISCLYDGFFFCSRATDIRSMYM